MLLHFLVHASGHELKTLRNHLAMALTAHYQAWALVRRHARQQYCQLDQPVRRTRGEEEIKQKGPCRPPSVSPASRTTRQKNGSSPVS